MNDPDYSMNDPLKLTVAEYAKRFNMSENTVRTRINRRKLKTVKEVVDTRETILILVEPSVDHSVNDSEQSEIVQGTVEDHSNEQDEQRAEQSEQSTELVSFMRETFQTVQAYSTQLVELSRENERYKLISETSTRTASNYEKEIEQLKDELFERDARIKTLEATQPADELLKEVEQLRQELQDLKDQNNALTAQLEASKKKGLLDRVFGR